MQLKLFKPLGIILSGSLLILLGCKTPLNDNKLETPVMGWSSWNTYHVDIIRMTSFVQQMYDAVKLVRFQPRQHLSNDVTFIKCTDIHSLTTCLQK